MVVFGPYNSRNFRLDDLAYHAPPKETHMAHLPRDPDTGDDTGVRPITDRPPRTPRWVKVFGIIALVLVLFFIIRLLLGAGGGHGPGRHRGGGAATAPSSGQQNPGGVGGPADAADAARTIRITTLDTMNVDPSRFNVSAGATVTFVVTNTGQAVHEFPLGDAAMQQQHAEAVAHIPARMAHDTPNSITLQPGVTTQLTWRFGDTTTLEGGCRVPGHYRAGMRGQIMVA
jgi:uncharacterized cupredoxin-like copper-binding protein